MQYERNFKGIWIPKEIWLSEDLSIQEKIMLVEIDSLENEEKGCYASNKYFSKFFNLTTQRISKILLSLQEKKFIEIKYIYEGKEIIERQIRIKKPPYPEVSTKIDTCQQKYMGGINYNLGGYQQKFKENNTEINNIYNNNIYIVQQVISYLNEKTNKTFKSNSTKTISLINTRIKEGYKIDDFKKVIDIKTKEWLNDKKYNKYLQPSTLFSNKFEGYLNQREEIEDYGVEYRQI